MLIRASTIFTCLLILLNRLQLNSADVFLDYPGDIKLGALFPIHKQGSLNQPCSEIQKEDGIQPLEAMLFTLDEINDNPNLLPGIRLGAKVFDSCDNPIHGVEKSLPLIKGFMARKANLTCDTACDDNIVGIIGPQTSAVSVQVANLGRLFRVPQVSYLSTSVTFCNREKFPYFFRTVPSDIHQAHAIIKLLESLDWNYVSVVHSDSEYGETGFESIRRAVGKSGKVCLTEPHVLHNQHFTPDDYEKIIKSLLSEPENIKPQVVIVFADRVPAGRLLEAAKRLHIKRKFVWVGSDAWASRESVVANRDEFVEGAIAIQPLMRQLPGFGDYFRKLVQTPNLRNPWFGEYLKAYYNCTNDPEQSPPYLPCNITHLSLRKFKNSQHFVRDAVYAFAHALHSLSANSCSSNESFLCEKFMKRVYYDLADFLSEVEFPDVDGNTFRFFSITPTTKPHDGPPRYSILNFQKDSQGQHDWQNVGTYYEELIFDLDKNFTDRYAYVNSEFRCLRNKCTNDQIKVPDTEDKCCWHCVPCNEFDYKVSEYECKNCPLGQRAVGDYSRCESIEPTYLDYTKPWAMGAITVASVGAFTTVLCTVAIIVYWNTTIMRTSGRELSMILLFGTFLSFMATFVIVSKPGIEVCAITRFSVGFCYTVCYAAVVTKTSRLSRIFNAGIRPRWTSPFSSTVIALALIIVEVIINIIWLIAEPPTTDYLVDKGKNILVCGGVDVSIVTGLAYPFVLILCATVYAFKTRKLPGTYNETKFIFFTNIVTTIHWFAYVPLYLASTNHEIRAVILAFSLSVSGLVQLCCFFLPKVYAVICKPAKRDSKPQTSRMKKYETPPHSVAVGFADGALLGDVSRYNLQNIFSLSSAAMSTDLSYPQMSHLQSLSEYANESSKEEQPKRQPTWSNHGLNMMERPRSRSFSVTRSTQTQKDLHCLVRDEPRTITFKAELSQMKDKSCDVMSDALCVTTPVTCTDEYDGLKFIDDNLTIDDDSKKE